jgi:hypothetical protein
MIPRKLSQWVGEKRTDIIDYISSLDNDLRHLYEQFASFISFKKIRVGSTDNYTEINESGDMSFAGTATMWEDIRVPVTSTTKGGSKDPNFTVYKTNTSLGTSSQGVFLYWFDKTTEEELYFTVQVPHSWKEGSAIYPHVHWVPASNGSATALVCWGLEYNFASYGVTATSSVFGTTSMLFANKHLLTDTSLAADTHYLTTFSNIAMTGHTISNMFVCRVFRYPTGTGTNLDNYNDDAGLLEIDFHYQQDAVGSKEEYNK